MNEILNRLNDLTALVNGIIDNAKKIFQLPIATAGSKLIAVYNEDSTQTEKLNISNYLEQLDQLNNRVITFGNVTRDVNTFTFEVGFEWQISSVLYANATDIERTIAEATENYYRIDIAVVDTNNDIVIVQGFENLTIATQPDTPPNTILLKIFNIFGDVIDDPIDPPIDTTTPTLQEVLIEGSYAEFTGDSGETLSYEFNGEVINKAFQVRSVLENEDLSSDSVYNNFGLDMASVEYLRLTAGQEELVRLELGITNEGSSENIVGIGNEGEYTNILITQSSNQDNTETAKYNLQFPTPVKSVDKPEVIVRFPQISESGIYDLATNADLADKVDKEVGSRLINASEITKLSNTSGTNSGDNATNSQYSGLEASKQNIPKLISANYTALNNEKLIVNDTCTITDVASPSNGTNYEVTIVNGSVTIGGVVYGSGVVVNRIYNSGAWKSYVSGQAVFTDTSDTSTIVGWSSYTFKIIREFDFGNGFVFVTYLISGTSNSASASFTLLNNNTTLSQNENTVQVINNGTTSNTNGLFVLGNASNVVLFYQNSQQTAFTGSGTKSVRGNFIYYKG